MATVIIHNAQSREESMKVRVAPNRIKQQIIEATQNFVNSLIEADYDHVYENLITTQSLELLSSMAWPLIFYKREKIDFLFSKLDEDPETDIVDALSLAFQMDAEQCRTGVFQGFAKNFLANRWNEFDAANVQVYLEGKYAIFAADTPSKPLFVLFARQKDESYLVDFEALWLFSMDLRASIILDIANQALSSGHKDIALEYYSIASKLKQTYTRIESLMCKHVVIGKYVTPLRKHEIREQLQLTFQAQERLILLKRENNLISRDNLSLEEYEKILRIINSMAIVMERSPDAFKGLREEHVRNHFLVQLNGHYPGGATGETFNFSGKTDILLKHDNINLFVAECKFWKSPRHFKDAIDQLLGYATWRDTKLALILFNRTKNLSDVISKIPDIVQSHSSYQQRLEYLSETGYRCFLRHRDDPQRHLLLTILVFEIPE